jgi:hypothetical protein
MRKFNLISAVTVGLLFQSLTYAGVGYAAPPSAFTNPPVATLGTTDNVIKVTTTDDSVGTGGCSLKDAIYAANSQSNVFLLGIQSIVSQCTAGAGHNVIVLPAGATLQLKLPAADSDPSISPTATPAITSDVTIEGNGATVEWVPYTQGRGGPPPKFARAFAVNAAGSLTIRNLLIKDFIIDGRSPANGGAGGIGAGGAILVRHGTLLIESSTFENNSAATPAGPVIAPAGEASGGGAIFGNGGSVTIRNSTFFNNRTSTVDNRGLAVATGSDQGGAILAHNGSLTIENATLSGNRATASGGAIAVLNAGASTSLTITNTLIAGNGASECFARGQLTSYGVGNLITANGAGGAFLPCPGLWVRANPKLGALSSNGGDTPTMAILDTSPAANAADPATSLPLDQRGDSRSGFGGFSIGAYEPCRRASCMYHALPPTTLGATAAAKVSAPSGSIAAAPSSTASSLSASIKSASGTLSPPSSPTLSAAAIAPPGPGGNPPTVNAPPPSPYVGPTSDITKVANAIQVKAKSLTMLVTVNPGLALSKPVTISIAIGGYRTTRLTQGYVAATGNHFLYNDPEGDGKPRRALVDITLTQAKNGGGTYTYTIPGTVVLDPLYDVKIDPLTFTLLNDCAVVGNTTVLFGFFHPDATQYSQIQDRLFEITGGDPKQILEFAWSGTELSASANLHQPSFGFDSYGVEPAPHFLPQPADFPTISLVPGHTRTVTGNLTSTSDNWCTAYYQYQETYTLRFYPYL